jgi:uncharacterized protein involved in exopolysaccharide biosynthesis
VGYVLPLLGGGIAMLLACIYIWSAQQLYEARTTVTARALKNSSGLPDINAFGLDLLGGLGGSTPMTSYDKLIEVLPSEEVAAKLLEDNDLMMRLFPGDWDGTAKQWRRPTGFTAGVRNALYGLFGFPSWVPIGTDPVVGMLKKRFRVISNNNDRSHTLFFLHPDPQTARDTLTKVLLATDAILRERDRQTNDANTRFLREKLLSETIVDVRDVLSRRLGEEFVNEALLANENSSYAYETLKSFGVSSRPVSPRPLLTLLLSFVAGAIAGTALLILVRRDWAQDGR